jgi:hypothetical protein
MRYSTNREVNNKNNTTEHVMYSSRTTKEKIQKKMHKTFDNP